MANAQVIATVVSISGKAYAKDQDGNVRVLKAGDALLEGETLITSAGGRVELALVDGSLMPVEEGQSLLITAELSETTRPQAAEAQLADGTIQQVIQALNDGTNLDDVLEEPAAGLAGGSGGEGNDFVRLLRISEGVDPLAFEFETANAAVLPELNGADAFGDSDTTALVNNPPTIEVSANPFVEGNASAGAVAGTYVTTDPDNTAAELTVSFTGNSNSGGYYALENGEVVLTPAGAALVNGGGVLPAIELTVTDPGNLTGTGSSTPAVTLVNDPPTINVSANPFVEGSASAGAVAGTYSVADPDNTTAELTVSFTGNSNSGGYYALENGQVVLTPAGAALVNGGGVLPAIELTVTDPGNLTGTGSSTPAVTLVNDPPTINVSANPFVEGSASAGAVAGTYSVADPDNTTAELTVSFTGNSNSGGYYALENGQVVLTAAGAALVNGGGTLPAIELTVTDPGGHAGTGADTPGVTLVNDAPTIDVSANSFTEGSAGVGAVAGTYNVADPDNATAELTVSFTGNSNSGGYYALENGQVVLTPAGAALVNGGGTLPAIELTVTDPGGLTGTGADTPGVTLVNDAPTITPTANDFVEGNATQGAVAATYVVSDSDNAVSDLVVSFTGTSNSAGYYALENGQVVLTAAGAALVNGGGTLPAIELTVTDPGGLTGTGADTPGVTLVNDAPTITPTANDFVEGNATQGAVAATYVVSDPDNAVSDLVVSFTGTSNSAGYYALENGQVVLTAAGAALVNGGGTLPAIELTVTDPGGLTGTGADTPGVTLVNDAPTIDVSANSFTEGSAGVGAVAGIYNVADPDNATAELTVSFTGNSNSGGYYALENGQVVLTPAGAALVNGGGTLPAIELTVTDPGGLTGTGADTPGVTLVNDAPTITPTANDFVEGNATQGAVAATYVVSDPDNAVSDLVVSFTGTSNSAGYYALENGQVVLTAAGAALVNGGGTLPAIELTVTDPGGLAGTGADTPGVTLVNDAPTIDVSANSFTEGSAGVGAVAGIYNVADPDNATAELTVSFTGNSNSGGYYALENGQVVLTPAGAALVNGGGTLPAIELTVTDPGGLTGTGADTPGVTLVNDAPETANTSATGDEDAASIPVSLSGSDVDGTVDHFVIKTLPLDGTLLLNGNPVAVGTEIPATGNGATISFVPNANWNGNTSFTYASVDNEGLEDPTPATASIGVTPVNDAPYFTTTTLNSSVSEEGLPGGVVDGTPVGTDTTNEVLAQGNFVFGDIDSTNLTLSLTAPTTELTSNGMAVIWSGGGTSTLTAMSADGRPVMSISISNTGAYTVTLQGAVDHPVAGVEDVLTLGVGVTVSDGELSSQATLNVRIEDDAPVAINDLGALSIGGVVSGNVLSNDLGADQTGKVVSITYGGQTYTPGTDGKITVTTPTGKLVIGQDGSYDYTSSLFTSTGGAGGLSAWSGVTLTALNGARNTASENEFYINSSGAPVATNVASLIGTGSFTSTANGLGISGGSGSAEYLNGHPTTPEAILVDLGNEVSSLQAVLYSQTNANASFNWATYAADGHLIGTGSGPISSGNFSLNVANSGGEAFQYVVFYGNSASIKVLLSSLEQVQFVEPQPESFTYNMTDADGDPSSATLTISQGTAVQPNQAPTAADGAVFGVEDTAYVFSWADFKVTDTDSDPSALGIQVTALPADGVLQVLSGGSWQDVALNQTISQADIASGSLRFVPAADESGSDVFGGTGVGNKEADYARFSFKPTDGIDFGAEKSLSIDIEPVGDAASFSVVLGNPVQVAVSQGTPVSGTLTSSNLFTATGVTVGAANVDPVTGQLTSVLGSNVYVGSDGKIGATGTHPGSVPQIGYSYTHDTSEQLVFKFDYALTSATASYSNLYEKDNGDTGRSEQGVYELYNNGVLVASGTFIAANNQNTGSVTMSVSGGGTFDTVVFKAQSGYAQGPGVETGDGSDYFITQLTYVGTTQPEVETRYPIDISVLAQDQDSSEALSSLSMSGIPAGAVLRDGSGNEYSSVSADSVLSLTGWDTSTLTVTPPSGSSTDFALQVSVSSVEPNGDTALSVKSFTVVVGSADAVAPGSELVGGSGNDALQGGAGNDSLFGDFGADTFVWKLSDGGTAGALAVDTVKDFTLGDYSGTGNVDRLDLVDLLQGENESTIDSFLNVEQVDGNTVLHVSSSGGFAGGYSAGAEDQTIVLENVTFDSTMNSHDIIAQLISNNQLLIDK